MEPQENAVDFSSFPAIALEVISDPVGFYRKLPRAGGYVEPLCFATAFGFAGILIQFLLHGLFGLGTIISFWMVLAWPILIAIFSFVGAGVMHVLWRVLGSQASYETSYRSAAFLAALSPITALLGIVPYLGTIVSMGWMAYLLIVASIEVHGVKPNTAYAVFGGIGLLLTLSSLGTERAARQLSPELERLGSEIEDMSPEEAGKAVGEFLRGLEQGAKEKSGAE